MSARIEINDSDVAQVKRLLADIKNGAKKALVTAINKTVTTTKVQVKKKLGQQINLKASRINEDLSISKANYTDISGSVSAKGEPVGLINFAGKQLKAGTKVKVYKAGTAKMLKHAFKATTKGKEHLWWRSSGSDGRLVGRLPVERLTGPRIEDVLAKPEIIEPIQKEAGDLLAKNIDNAVVDILRRHNG